MIADDKTIEPCPHCGARRGWDAWADRASSLIVLMYDQGCCPWTRSLYPVLCVPAIRWHELYECRACGETVT